jgi:hypothetical protein
MLTLKKSLTLFLIFSHLVVDFKASYRTITHPRLPAHHREF